MQFYGGKLWINRRSSVNNSWKYVRGKDKYWFRASLRLSILSSSDLNSWQSEPIESITILARYISSRDIEAHNKFTFPLVARGESKRLSIELLIYRKLGDYFYRFVFSDYFETALFRANYAERDNKMGGIRRDTRVWVNDIILGGPVFKSGERSSPRWTSSSLHRWYPRWRIGISR